MSTQHRKPLAAFVVLAFLMAGIVGVQKADAQAGRFLAAAVGAGVRVEGALPGASLAEPDARETVEPVVAGPAVTALTDPAGVHGPGGWSVAEELATPALVVGREAAGVAARWVSREQAARHALGLDPRAEVRGRVAASARSPRAQARPAPAHSRWPRSHARPDRVRTREEGRRPVTAAAASSWRSARALMRGPAATGSTQPARVVPAAPKAADRAPGQGRSWRHSRPAVAAERGTRTHRHGHARGGLHGHGHARGGVKAAARR